MILLLVIRVRTARISPHRLLHPHPQACIDSAVAREMAANTIALSELVAGRAQTFTLVHTSAVVSLLAGAEVVTEATVPETLLFDVHRLAVAQVEFRRIVVSATVFVSARHAILAAGGPLQPKQGVIASLATALVEGANDYEPVRANLYSALDAAGISVDRAQLDAAFVSGGGSVDSVHLLM